MKLLVLHRIPYHKVRYELGIDHELHDVTYVGTAAALANLPADLRCTRVSRPGVGPVHAEVLACFPQATDFDRVISLSEYELLDAARVREAWGVPGPALEDVLLVRDKVRMKAAVAAAGIRVPRFAEIGGEISWSGPTVLKPRSGASSEGVAIHPSVLDAIRAVPREAQESWELEEYVDGPILHIDGLVEDGEIRVIVASQYVGTCLDYARGKPLGSYQLETSPELNAWASRCLSAVRIEQGSFHLEAILSPDGLVFLEVANRVGGADVVDTFELATGVYLPAEELRLIIGEEMKAQPRVPDLSYGWFVFPGHHLTFRQGRVVGTQAFRRSPQTVRWNELRPDQALPRSITYQAVEAPVAGVVRGRTSRETREFLERAFAEVRIMPALLAAEALAAS